MMRALCFILVLCLAGTPARAEDPVERGRYLVTGNVGCGNCHTPWDADGQITGREMAGGLVIDEPAFTAHVPNITSDRETGIGTWTDAELALAIREGRRPDGTLIGPPMPIELYRGIADGDLAAIVAYMRTVPAIRNRVPPSRYNFPLPPSYGPPVAAVAEVPRADQLAYGAYLAGPLGHCIECHTPMAEGGRPDYEGRLGAGGFALVGPWGTSVSANITSHPEDGIGAWTDDEIRAAITRGVRPDGDRLAPPMATSYYARMRRQDLDALVAYLRSLPPLPD